MMKMKVQTMVFKDKRVLAWKKVAFECNLEL